MTTGAICFAGTCVQEVEHELRVQCQSTYTDNRAECAYLAILEELDTIYVRRGCSEARDLGRFGLCRGAKRC